MNFNDESPIYIQIANAIEDGILNGIYEEVVLCQYLGHKKSNFFMLYF